MAPDYLWDHTPTCGSHPRKRAAYLWQNRTLWHCGSDETQEMGTGRSVCTLWSEAGSLRREGINKAEEMTSCSFAPCEIQQSVTSSPSARGLLPQ